MPAAGASAAELKSRRREDYPYILDYRTRWNDNDMYDHMNNSVYNMIFDSVVNTYLMQHCGLHPPTSPEHPLAVHSRSEFFASIAYPAVAEVGLRVGSLGKSSVSYEVALFEKGVDGVKAAGEFVHVFVGRETGRPMKGGMKEEMRKGLERLCNTPGTSGSKL